MGVEIDVAADPVALAVRATTAMPLPADDSERRWNLRTATVAWLTARKSLHTRRARETDLREFLAWADRTGMDVRTARRGDVDAYGLTLAHLSPATVARKLSNISSWFQYLISNDVIDSNPVKVVDRPKVDRDASATVGLSAQQVTAFMKTARNMKHPNAARDAALLGTLAELGLRVGEALALTFADLRHNRGHRTVRVIGKGSKVRELPIPAPLGRDLDRYLEERAAADGVGDTDTLEGPVFVTASGRRLDQPAAFRLVRRVAAAAGLPNAGVLSPHSLRHTVATAALDAGAALRDVQDLLGHADSRTTRRYDRSRGNLDRSPAYLLAGLFAHDEG